MPPARRGPPANWLIRSQHNRKTTKGEKLWERLAQSAAAGRGRVHPACCSGPSSALVRQTLYRQAVTLSAHRGQLAVTVTAILNAGKAAAGWAIGVGVAVVDQPDGNPGGCSSTD